MPLKDVYENRPLAAFTEVLRKKQDTKAEQRTFPKGIHLAILSLQLSTNTKFTGYIRTIKYSDIFSIPRLLLFPAERLRFALRFTKCNVIVHTYPAGLFINYTYYQMAGYRKNKRRRLPVMGLVLLQMVVVENCKKINAI
jgi:hypothetical protein